MELLNLTPHAITIRNAEGEDIVIPPSGNVARVSTTTEEVVVEGAACPIIRTAYGEVEGMPNPPAPCVVSGLVLSRLGAEWTGVAFGPATGPKDGAIRDEDGKIIAVTKLVTV